MCMVMRDIGRLRPMARGATPRDVNPAALVGSKNWLQNFFATRSNPFLEMTTLKEKLSKALPKDEFLDYEEFLSKIDNRDWESEINVHVIVTEKKLKNLLDFLSFYSFEYSEGGDLKAGDLIVKLVLAKVKVPNLNLFEGLTAKSHCFQEPDVLDPAKK